MNPILETNPIILVMNLQSIDPLVVFRQIELKVGLKLLQIIGKPFEEFRIEYKEILELISELLDCQNLISRSMGFLHNFCWLRYETFLYFKNFEHILHTSEIEWWGNLDDQEFNMVDRLENYNNLFIGENHEKRN